ncbi:MAG: Glycosyl transferase, family 2 [Candidatus Roizmanbacteria bacterium GW2011_GWA2_34_18]|uniref:Glycosyl transferase, family 2 n=1 Tax=Candidatus Roizmanbacteria bacterium GW2011_GWA2_34_18 TaxID=1618477 RepID=A0A0G0DY16_9BACT|nr:MAG: Glycosyl transferase, family 2 [Candidatus Roizmanbacteria bacterium GW2011_GWA2_34_18]
MIPLSIIIVSFNTKEITKKCLLSLKKNFIGYPLDYEVIVIDNNSQDGSLRLLLDLEKGWKNLHVFLSKKNLGFSKGNNFGLEKSKGKYILYLNSDVIVADIDFRDLIELLEIQKDIGALTVKVVLPTGEIDPASHRGFPTLWRSFAYFSGLEKIFKNIPMLNKLFGGYHLVNLNLNEIHEIDVFTGAFLFIKREIVDKFGGFDKDYFAYGEDIEMAFQIKELGYKIIYYPLWTVLHLKSASGLKKKDIKIREKTSFYFYDSMKIFYQKHYAKDHNWLINQLVYLIIDIKKNFAK